MTEFSFLSLEEQVAAMHQVAEVALASWPGTFPRKDLIKYRENGVFGVENSEGRKFALRIHRHGYHTDNELLSELQWMAALASAGVPVPGIVPAKSGALMARIQVGSFPVFQVDMLDWLSGEPVGSAEEGSELAVQDLSELYFEVGALAARLHDHAGQWRRPSGFVRHSWDEEGLIGAKPFWGQFRGLPALKEHLPLIDDVCRRARNDLEKLGKSPDCYGLIHADLVPENLLKCDTGLMLLDFDDAGYGWHLFELATALYFYVGRSEYPALRDSIIAGYQSVRPLSAFHLDNLELFLALRGLTYLGWVTTRSETQTAKEMTAFLVAQAVQVGTAYLQKLE